jgi:hypothetical protein
MSKYFAYKLLIIVPLNTRFAFLCVHIKCIYEVYARERLFVSAVAAVVTCFSPFLCAENVYDSFYNRFLSLRLTTSARIFLATLMPATAMKFYNI